MQRFKALIQVLLFANKKQMKCFDDFCIED